MRWVTQSESTGVGSGFGGALLVGARVGHFRIVIPIHVRRKASGLSARWSVDTMPYIGIEVAL